jgi:AcrR family transcriptional regulator
MVQHPSDNARERIVAATIAAINRGGEPAVRLVEVARNAGVTQGMISYYFDSREGLIVEAQLRRFLGSVNEDTSQLEGFRAATQAVVDRYRAATREVRLNVLGSAVARPELHAALAKKQTELINLFTEVVAIGQERGLVRTDRDARALASFVQAYAFGLVLVDMDTERVDDDDLVDVIMDWLETVVVTDRSSRSATSP